MSMSYRDFVEDAKIMLRRSTPATENEIKKYLNGNDVHSHADEIIKDARSEIQAESVKE